MGMKPPSILAEQSIILHGSITATSHFVHATRTTGENTKVIHSLGHSMNQNGAVRDKSKVHVLDGNLA